MSKKKMKKLDLDNFFVYSTDPNYSPEEDNDIEEVSLKPEEQRLFVRKEKKGRGGKVVTIVEGFEGTDEDLEALGKDLKKHCGTGGSVKEGEIIIQGDIADKIVRFLTNSGYSAKKTTM